MLPQKWKPISTAPKGIYLLLYCADGFFNADTLMEVATVEQFEQTATHWQALPNVPETETQFDEPEAPVTNPLGYGNPDR